METTKEFETINSLHPRIAKNIKIFWGTEFFIEYTSKLVLDTRDGKRKGFSNEVLKAMMGLIKMHDEQFPRKPRIGFDDTTYRL